MSQNALPENLLIYNAFIYTQCERRQKASVLATKGFEILYVGDDISEAKALLGPNYRAINLNGLFVIPALFDGHAHLISEGESLGQLNLHGLDYDQCLASVKKEGEKKPEGEWIIGQGWNQKDWPGIVWPKRQDLDSVAPNHPVILDRSDKHSAWVNSLALEKGALTADSLSPAGGEYLKDAQGQLLGVLIGNAMWSIKNIVPPLSKAEQKKALLRAQEEIFSYGICSVMEAGVTMDSLALMEESYATGDLKLRIWGMMLAYDKSYQAYLNAGLTATKGLYNERFGIGGIKIHSDGSLGSRSAWLSQAYADRPGHFGGHSYGDEELLHIMNQARDNGLIISIHAIGDAAVTQALKNMEISIGHEKNQDRRWRLEHFQLVQDNDLHLAVKLGLIASIQSVGLMNDLSIAEDRLGPELVNLSYPWQEFLKKGGRLVNGSDAPVESINPFEGLYAAVSRSNLKGRPKGGWRPKDKLSRAQALATYSKWAAYAEFSENRKGLLAPSYLADFIVIDRDFFTCPENEIKDIKNLMTVLGGEIVYFKM